MRSGSWIFSGGGAGAGAIALLCLVAPLSPSFAESQVEATQGDHLETLLSRHNVRYVLGSVQVLRTHDAPMDCARSDAERGQ